MFESDEGSVDDSPEQIKLCRKQLGMSQADLADAIWVSRNTVSNWERGEYHT